MSEQMLLAIKYYSLILVRLAQGPGREQVEQRDLPRRLAALPVPIIACLMLLAPSPV